MEMLTKPLRRLIEDNVTVKKLFERMIEREGKSEETLRRYLEGIQSFTEYLKCSSPDGALEKVRVTEDVTEVLDDYVGFLISRQFTPINLKAHFFGVKKWFVANRVNGIDWQYISRPKVSSQIKDRIPTREELKLILSNKITLRDKAFFMTALSSGLRIGTLVTLQVSDYEPIEELGMIKVTGGPNRKLARGKRFHTFITPETREVLEGYLKTRESLSPNSPLFAKENGERMSAFVTNIGRQWRRLTRRANLAQKIENHKYTELHAHVLRKFFQTTSKLSGCRSDFVEFWLGHHPASPEHYMNDSYFRPTLESHVQEYRKAVLNLSVFEDSSMEELKGRLREKDIEMRILDEKQLQMKEEIKKLQLALSNVPEVKQTIEKEMEEMKKETREIIKQAHIEWCEKHKKEAAELKL